MSEKTHTAIIIGKSLYTWGSNSNGQLGLGDTINRNKPQKIPGEWQYVATGLNYTMAIDINGYMWGCGVNNQYSQLGDGTSIQRNSFVKIGAKTWKKVVCDERYTIAIDTDGYMWGCGYGRMGGNNNNVVRSTFVKLNDMIWVDVSINYYYILAIDTDGYMWGCGDGSKGEFGDNLWNVKTNFVKIGTKTWKKVACSFTCSRAIDTDGYMWEAGYIFPKDSNTVVNKGEFTQIQENLTFTDIYCIFHFIALGTDGFLYGNGPGNYGVFGKSATYIYGYEKITNDIAVNVYAGHYLTIYFNNKGEMWGAGRNDYGQLGDGTNAHKTQFTRIYLSDPVTRYLFTTQNTAYAISDNALKSLGTITTANASTLFANGLETITKDDCILVGQQLGKAKIIKMDV